MVLALVTTLTAACGGGGDDKPGPEAGAKGRIAPGPASTIFADASSTTSVVAEGASTTTGAGGRAATTRPGQTAPSSTTPPGASPEVQATAALNAYLDGLASERYGDAMNASAEGPRMVAFIRSLFKTYNESKGGTSTLKYTTRNFTIASAPADRITFSGRAVLAQTTRSGDRSATSNSEIRDPVTRNAGGWKVADLLLDGKPVVLHRSDKETRHPGAPVSMRLVGALNSANSTGVVVAFAADKGARVQVDQDVLAFGAATRPSTVRILAGSYAYFSYARRDDRPTEWRARVTIDGSAAQIKISF